MTDFDWNAKPIRPLTHQHMRDMLLEGCSEREISEVCGVALGTVQRMSRSAFPTTLPYGVNEGMRGE